MLFIVIRGLLLLFARLHGVCGGVGEIYKAVVLEEYTRRLLCLNVFIYWAATVCELVLLLV